MKKSILSLAGAHKLSVEEQKNVLGGLRTDCAYYMPTGNASGGPVVTYNVSMADAQSGAAGFEGGRWCCDSCSEASWYGI